MLETIELLLQTTCQLDKKRPVLVGVSGGADSVCLLDVLIRLEYPVIVAHFDHQLRPGSKEEAKAVERLSAKMNVFCKIGQGDVHAVASQRSMSIEEAAREMRYRFLFDIARQYDAQAIAVGHTADDQVETVLMHFLRGAGLSGLKGMLMRTILPVFDADIPLIRPLLESWREEIVVYCAARGLRYHQDPSNAELNFFRNRLRHVLIPTLESYNPKLREAIWRMSKTLTGDYEAAQELVEHAWQDCFEKQGQDFMVFWAAKFLAQPLGVQRGLLRRAFMELRPARRDLSFTSVERTLELLAHSNPSMRVDVEAGISAFIENSRLVLAGDNEQQPAAWPQVEAVVHLSVPGAVSLSNGWVLTVEEWKMPALAIAQMHRSKNPFEAWLDAEGIPEQLTIRGRRAGERFQPLGMKSGSVKLSDFLINEKMPQRARDRWPLLCAGDETIWVPGYRPAHRFRLTESTYTVLYFTLEKEKELR